MHVQELQVIVTIAAIESLISGAAKSDSRI